MGSGARRFGRICGALICRPKPEFVLSLGPVAFAILIRASFARRVQLFSTWPAFVHAGDLGRCQLDRMAVVVGPWRCYLRATGAYLAFLRARPLWSLSVEDLKAMAKALLGHVGGPDPRMVSEMRRLQRRVRDLEAELARLQEVNDVLAAGVGHEILLDEREPALT